MEEETFLFHLKYHNRDQAIAIQGQVHVVIFEGWDGTQLSA